MKKINNRKFLFPVFSIFLLSTPLVALSCKKNETNNLDGNLKWDPSYSDKEFDYDYRNLTSSNNIEDHFDLNIQNHPDSNIKNLSPEELKEKELYITITPKNKNLLNKIDFQISNVIIDHDELKDDEAIINVIFTIKNTKKQESFQYRLLGLKKSPNSLNNTRYLKSLGNNKDKIKIAKYINSDQNQRFKKDNDEYLSNIKEYLEKSLGIKDWSDWRKNVKASTNAINKFNQTAAKIGQDNYENLALKGFSLPSYNEKNEVEGIELYEGNELGKMPSWIDSLGKNDVYKTSGLARKIVNEKYLDIAKQTFSINLTRKNLFTKEITELTNSIEYWKKENKEQEFRNLINQKIEELRKNKEILASEWDARIKNNSDSSLTQGLLKKKNEELGQYDANINHYTNHTLQKEIEILEKKVTEFRALAAEDRYTLSENGTMWILDYQLNENGYPTKWYFGTNSHVAKALTKDLTSFAITKIDSNLKVGTNLNVSRLDDNITTFYFNNKDAIKKVFDGVDYLKDNPSKFLIPEQREKYKDYGAFTDFAVLEIDFTKINNFSALSNENLVDQKYLHLKDNNFAQNLAKEITNNYANNKDKQIKFVKNSYLKDYKKIDFPLKGKFNKDQEYLYAVGWPQSSGDFYLDQYKDALALEQARINFSLWFNSEYEYYESKINQQIFNLENKKDQGNFLSYNVGYRTFSNLPGLVDTFLAVPKFGDGFYELDGKKYINISLGYMPRRYAPVAGASGSSIRNQNNELVSIYYATNSFGRVGLSSAFRSEGFNYQGLYGQYNLPQYDLIYGGGKDQTKSYKDELKKLYGDAFKTNLFANGISKENPDFKFSNILTY
ncbi:Ig-specific serine endopeptidase MIP [Metamycoplasma auris]|uniref:Putative peptidase DUF31 n=1 Tax=Metamycoplasma auris TaxID=51363 RepID=A0A2W7I2C5_9BACT|nr:DUF31 family protein [Metamycoplasma auris]PZW01586.1 putative peptidase DUF31 [Metamycoplasma auris]